MRIVEFVGPTGAGKSAIYRHMAEHGGFVGNPQMTVEEARGIVEAVAGQDARLDDFISFLKYIERTGKGEKFGARICALWRALAKNLLARTAPDDPRWMVIDGGLIHRGQSVDRIEPRMPLERYYQMQPLPDVVFAVDCQPDVLAARNANRGGSHDRRDDMARERRCYETALTEIRNRGVPVIPVDSTTLKPDKAARICLTRLGILRKYEEQEAADYDQSRTSQEKWVVEQRIIQDMLDDLPRGTIILDAPVGTGRFIQFYEQKGFVMRGLDQSADMLREAAKKVSDPASIINGDKQFHFCQGDVRDTKFADKSVDVAVCVRITRWLGPDGVCGMLREMQRVARDRILFTARVRDHHHAIGYDLIQSALDGWSIARDRAGYVDAYRIIELKPHD